MAETKPSPEQTSVGDDKNTTGSGADDGTQPDKTENAKPTFTQEDVSSLVSRAVKAEREKAQKAKEDEDKKRAEEDLKAQNKHKELAETREKERDAAVLERDDYKGKYEALAETVTKSVDAEVKALPEEFRELAPEGLDARLEWLPKAKKMAEKLTGEPKPGNSRGPKPVGTTPQDTVNDIVARKRASGQYSR